MMVQEEAQETSPTRGEGSGGWAPAFGEARQKDMTRVNERARRLRREQTPSEQQLWKLLRHVSGAHFRRQAAVGPFVFDCADFGARLLIELDGGVHSLPDVALRDQAKSEWARVQGFKLLRLTNHDVWNRPDWLLDQVRAVRNAPHPCPSPQGGGE